MEEQGCEEKRINPYVRLEAYGWVKEQDGYPESLSKPSATDFLN
jgi:hypothetical protein